MKFLDIEFTHLYVSCLRYWDVSEATRRKIENGIDIQGLFDYA